jgi:chaperonin GroES
MCDLHSHGTEVIGPSLGLERRSRQNEMLEPLPNRHESPIEIVPCPFKQNGTSTDYLITCDIIIDPGTAIAYRPLTLSVHRKPAMKLRPLGDRLIVRRLEVGEKSTGGIILPDNAKQKPAKGTVLATGPGKMMKDGTRRPLQVKEGDTILFSTWAGDEFKDRSKKDEILIMHEEDVLAVIG